MLAGQPFDMVKVRMQTMPIVPGQKPLYSGAMDCTRQIIAKEGVSFRLHKSLRVFLSLPRLQPATFSLLLADSASLRSSRAFTAACLRR